MAAGNEKKKRQQLCTILHDMNDEDFEKFKWNLNLEDKGILPKSEVRKATREDMADLLVNKYPCKYRDITKTVLENCGQNHLAENLFKCEAVQSENIRGYKEKLQSNLQDRFQCVQEGCAKKRDEQLLDDIYTELDVTAGCPSDVSPRHEERAAGEQPVDTEETIRPSQVFLAPAGRSIRTVLTSGNAGIGKTFFVRKFVLDWATRKANKDIQLVFPFTFRQLNLWKTEEKSLSELIHTCVGESSHIPEEKLNHIFMTLQSSGNTNFEKSAIKILFILDGLDESQLNLQCSTSRDPQMNLDVTERTTVENLVSRLINKDLLPSARLWITTRPAAAGQIHPDLIDVVTEVRGFTDQQKEEYFTKKKNINDKEQAKTILSHIKKSRNLHAMCHIPFFCWITDIVLKHLLKTKVKENLPTGLTEMYIHFLVQSKRNQDKSRARNYSGLEIQSLGKLAFEQLQNENLIFKKTDLDAHNVTMRIATDSGMITQLIREDRGLYTEEVYSFVHLSVQEFLAALHVHLTFSNTGVNLLTDSKARQASKRIPDASRFYQTAINKALDCPKYDLFLRFLLGLSLQDNQKFLQNLVPCEDSSSLARQKVLDYLKKKIGEDKSQEGITKDINLFHCLSELNDCSPVENIQKIVRRGNLPVSLSQWSALCFILLSSEEVGDVFDLTRYYPSDEVLLRLMPLVKDSKTSLLNCCNLSERSCAALFSALSSPTCNLTMLDLSNNDLQDSGVKLLCKGLQSPNCKLECLRLSGCLITADGCSSLALALNSKQSTVRDLDVSYNHPETIGAKQLKAWQQAASRKRSCRLEPFGQQWLTCGLGKYWVELSMDTNTIHRFLALSDNNSKLSWNLQGHYEDHPERFDWWPQVLCGNDLTGRCYWEVEWDGAVYLSVVSRDVQRGTMKSNGMTKRGCTAASWFGRNRQSWCLRCDEPDYYVCYDKTKTSVRWPDKNSKRVGMYLDYPAGTLSFYCVSGDKELHLYTFETTFSEPLCAGFGLCWPMESYVRLICAQEAGVAPANTSLSNHSNITGDSIHL